jgi:hypothetical protein
MNPFGSNLLATMRALLSQLSSAIFWASMTSPIGSAHFRERQAGAAGAVAGQS